MNDLVKKIESYLFARAEPVLLAELGRVMGVSGEELLMAVRDLVGALEGHGLTLLLTDTEVELVTRGEMADFLQTFLDDTDSRLSKAAAETLAIMAYRGPISRYELGSIRGVDCRAIINQLRRRGLLTRHNDDAGVALYDLSAIAWKQMGLDSREALPDFDVLSSHERLLAYLEQDSS